MPEEPTSQPNTPTPSPVPTQPTPAEPVPSKALFWHNRWLWIGVSAAIVVIAAVAAGFWLGAQHSNTAAPNKTATTTTQTPVTTATTTPTTAQGLQLDTSKNYGNTYSSGMLPVGDGKYSSTGTKVGYVYVCGQYAQNLAGGSGGASTRGPWFTNNNTEYDVTKKVHVAGSVTWQASFTNTVSGATRTIVTNDLPDHITGVFPISRSDPAYQYDRNPNTIRSQSLTYNLSASPTYGQPSCMGGEAGIMLTGVALFNAFDAGGRDAGAWEVQDSCSGHPQMDGIYHYHTLSSCIKDVSVHTVIGFALDGFPITGPQISSDNILTTSDLDECHGITSQIVLDGKNVTMYHYVMTQDFPYSVSCFRGTAIQPPDLAH